MHVQFYLNLLDTYVPDETTRFEAFAAVENIPSQLDQVAMAEGGSRSAVGLSGPGSGTDEPYRSR